MKHTFRYLDGINYCMFYLPDPALGIEGTSGCAL